jgi:hypothetical protein
MKKVQLVFVLFLLTAITAAAQVCAPHPTDPGATLIGSFTVTIDIAQSATVNGKSGKKGTKCTSEQLICVWRTSTGGTDLIGDPTTVKFSGSCLTDIPASDLFGMFGQAAVVKAVGLGYVQCSPVCDATVAARYLTATCVSKNGNGNSTRFDPCTTVQCVRSYTVCCPNGPDSPTVNRAPADNAGCGAAPAGCQSACDQNCPPATVTVQ